MILRAQKPVQEAWAFCTLYWFCRALSWDAAVASLNNKNVGGNSVVTTIQHIDDARQLVERWSQQHSLASKNLAGQLQYY